MRNNILPVWLHLHYTSASSSTYLSSCRRPGAAPWGRVLGLIGGCGHTSGMKRRMREGNVLKTQIMPPVKQCPKCSFKLPLWTTINEIEYYYENYDHLYSYLPCHYYESHSAEGLAPMVFICNWYIYWYNNIISISMLGLYNLHEYYH